MQIAVIGREACSEDEYAAAERAGQAIAEHHAVLCCGGGGGVMEAASRGAKALGGTTIGIIPGTGAGNTSLDATIRTGMGYARNVILVLSADAIVAVGGGYGTLSEIAIALKSGKPVFGYRTWEIEGVVHCLSPEDAVLMAVRAALP